MRTWFVTGHPRSGVSAPGKPGRARRGRRARRRRESILNRLPTPWAPSLGSPWALPPGAIVLPSWSGAGYANGMVLNPTIPATDAPTTVLPVVQEYIGVRPGHCGGKPHLLGHRVKVQ